MAAQAERVPWVIVAGGFRLVAGEIRDGRIRRVRGEPIPIEEDDEESTRP